MRVYIPLYCKVVFNVRRADEGRPLAVGGKVSPTEDIKKIGV